MRIAGAPQGCLVGDLVQRLPCAVAGLTGELALGDGDGVVLVLIGSMVGRVVLPSEVPWLRLLLIDARDGSSGTGFGEPLLTGTRVRRRLLPYGVSWSCEDISSSVSSFALTTLLERPREPPLEDSVCFAFIVADMMNKLSAASKLGNWPYILALSISVQGVMERWRGQGQKSITNRGA